MEKYEKGLKAGPKITLYCYLVPVLFFLLGSLSIILLKAVERINERGRIDAARSATLMDIQIHASMGHIQIEEAYEYKASDILDEAMSHFDQAIRLAEVLLTGGKTEHDEIPGPQRDTEMQEQVKEIKSMLIQVKMMIPRRFENPGSKNDLDRHVDPILNEILRKTRALEELTKIDNARKRETMRRLFVGIQFSWTVIIIVAAIGLWNGERRRRRTERELVQANFQLISQSEELKEHRERLTDLVEKRTSELSTVNDLLLNEIEGHKQAEVTLMESEKQLRDLSARLMTAQETERKSISRELHDELGHALTIMKLRLKSVARVCQGNAGSKEECEDIMGYIDQTIENVRRLSRDLSPAILEDLGLTAAIRWLVDNFNRNVEGTITLDMENIDSLFSEDASMIIYRVLQEAITNMGKHADARDASVIVRKVDGAVAFSIEDNGRGFNPFRSSGPDSVEKGLGLAIMEERVRMLMGILTIQSKEGRGTRISFTIPAQKE